MSKFLSDRRQCLRLNSKVNASADVVSGVSQSSVLRPLLLIFYISELFHIVENHIMGYAQDTMIYAVIPRLLSRPQVMEKLNQNLGAIHSRCFKWHMRLNPKKTKSMVVSRSRTYTPGYVDL